VILDLELSVLTAGLSESVGQDASTSLNEFWSGFFFEFCNDRILKGASIEKSKNKNMPIGAMLRGVDVARQFIILNSIQSNFGKELCDKLVIFDQNMKRINSEVKTRLRELSSDPKFIDIFYGLLYEMAIRLTSRVNVQPYIISLTTFLTSFHRKKTVVVKGNNRRKQNPEKEVHVTPTLPWQLAGLTQAERAGIKKLLSPFWGEAESFKNKMQAHLIECKYLLSEIDIDALKSFIKLPYAQFFAAQWVWKDRVRKAINERVKALGITEPNRMLAAKAAEELIGTNPENVPNTFKDFEIPINLYRVGKRDVIVSLDLAIRYPAQAQDFIVEHFLAKPEAVRPTRKSSSTVAAT
jgi:hypothetical protein